MLNSIGIGTIFMYVLLLRAIIDEVICSVSCKMILLCLLLISPVFSQHGQGKGAYNKVVKNLEEEHLFQKAYFLKSSLSQKLKAYPSLFYVKYFYHKVHKEHDDVIETT
jgi:hypothetical protein